MSRRIVDMPDHQQRAVIVRTLQAKGVVDPVLRVDRVGAGSGDAQMLAGVFPVNAFAVVALELSPT